MQERQTFFLASEHPFVNRPCVICKRLIRGGDRCTFKRVNPSAAPERLVHAHCGESFQSGFATLIRGGCEYFERSATKAHPAASNRVLVAAFDPNIRALFTETLEKHGGYQVVATDSGPSATQAARKFHPALVIAEVALPGMSGIEAAVTIKQKAPEYEVLLFSGMEEPQLRDYIDSKKLGESHFEVLRIPCSPEHLLDKARDYLSGPLEFPELRKPRILIIDDSEECRSGLAELLSLWGYDPTTAASPEEAFRGLRESRPDLIITDLGKLPFDALEFLRQLCIGGHQPIPVILTESAPGLHGEIEREARGYGLYKFAPCAGPEELHKLVAEGLGQELDDEETDTETKEILDESRPSTNERRGGTEDVANAAFEELIAKYTNMEGQRSNTEFSDLSEAEAEALLNDIVEGRLGDEDDAACQKPHHLPGSQIRQTKEIPPRHPAVGTYCDICDLTLTGADEIVELSSRWGKPCFAHRSCSDEPRTWRQKKTEWRSQTASCEPTTETPISVTLSNRGLSPDQIMQVTWLRAVEWLAWPSFVSQPLLPIGFLLYPWYVPVGLVILLNVAWLFVRYETANFQLATWGCYFVKLKWISIVAVALYAASKNEWATVALAASTPLIAMASSSFMGGQIGVMQKIFLAQLGVASANEGS